MYGVRGAKEMYTNVHLHCIALLTNKETVWVQPVIVGGICSGRVNNLRIKNLSYIKLNFAALPEIIKTLHKLHILLTKRRSQMAESPDRQCLKLSLW